MKHIPVAGRNPSIAGHLNATRSAIATQLLNAQPNSPREDFDGWVHYGLAIGASLGVLPLLYPDAHTLPSTVVLEPLLTPPAAPPPSG
jgi:hypothetical protein